MIGGGGPGRHAVTSTTGHESAAAASADTGQWRAAAAARCRFCAQQLNHTFVDLGMSPLCQTHIEPYQLNHMERFYPLHAWVCERCFLVQLEMYVAPDDIFSDYAYFSSYSDSWVEHARRYCEAMIGREKLGAKSLVMEIASNDGYLLQHFVKPAFPAAASSPRRTWRRPRSRRVFRRRSSSSASRPRPRSPPNTAGRTSCSATTCWRTCRTSTTSSAA
jgi:hypothetical protein